MRLTQKEMKQNPLVERAQFQWYSRRGLERLMLGSVTQRIRGGTPTLLTLLP